MFCGVCGTTEVVPFHESLRHFLIRYHHANSSLTFPAAWSD
jgi:hypothetical protein